MADRQAESVDELNVGPFERIALKMTSSLHLEEVLTSITQNLVDELDATFARIWLIGPGDLCSQCHMDSDCANRETCLHLVASAGKYTNLNGEYRRVPLGTLKIGRIAQDDRPLFTNDVMNDERLPNKKWLHQNGFRSFAGYPLVFRGKTLGVVAMFSQRIMDQGEANRMAVFANQAAIAIQNAQLYSEVDQLKKRLEAENIYLQEEIKLEHNFEEIIGRSGALKKVLRKVEQVASTGATILIQGETGTGKELIARAVHNLSTRKERPLVKVNCAALPATLIESELFGHERGAFTGAVSRRSGRFELADRGTIFLDEIGDLPLDLQAKLLRVLQEGEFERLGGSSTIKTDVRIIGSTNRDLKKATADKEFREDLYFRLNVFPLLLPPLRERQEDIPLLARHFTLKHGSQLGKKIDTIPEKVMDLLQAYPWPGNVRELENIIERAVILTSGSKLEIDESLEMRSPAAADPGGSSTLKEVSRKHILEVLEESRWRIQGNQGAALRLGLKPSTLRSQMHKLGISKP